MQGLAASGDHGSPAIARLRAIEHCIWAKSWLRLHDEYGLSASEATG
jgi:hypothetical protein